MADSTRSLSSYASRRSSMGSSNMSSSERWMSAAVGLGLALQTARSRGLLGRLLLGSASLSLLARGAAGYCAMKSTLSGDTTLTQGVREQVRRLRATVAAETVRSVDSMEMLYVLELQELHSAESQLANVIERLAPTVQNEPLALRLDEYVTELRSRRVDLESMLARIDVDARSHRDDAMLALLDETEKMAHVCAPTLKDAAITASLQRIIHYKIAGYGTIAAYAKVLGRTEQASHFAELADRDEAVDAELTQLAKGTLNPKATNAAVTDPIGPGSARTH